MLPVLVARSQTQSGNTGTCIEIAPAAVASFAYNAAMTLGASALVRPLRVSQPGQLHAPLMVMLAALGAALLLAWRAQRLNRAAGLLLLACYPAFLAAAVLVG